MCLIISTLAAVFSTLIWYVCETARKLKVSILCWLFWGASIMWLVDLIFKYAQSGNKIFSPTITNVLNDTLLGVSIITIALVIWIAFVLITDPNGVIQTTLKNNIQGKDKR